MHLDLDAFFASVEQKLDPSLIGKPILVGRVDPQGRSVPRGVVATCSYEARAFGCHSGMPLFQALKLCPRAIVVGGHYEEYIKASEKVFSICRRYAPVVEQTGLDEGFLDFSNTDLIYPNLTIVAGKIKEEIKREIGITASIGIASAKVVAKVASDFQKPDGLTYVEKGQEKRFLSPLSLLDLPGVSTKTYEKIATILIDSNVVKQVQKITIGDLALFSEGFIEERLGKAGLSLWNSANGRDNIWFTSGFGFYKEGTKSISRSETFERNSNNLKFILAKLQALSEDVGKELRAEGYFGRCVHVTIRYGNFNTVSCQRVLPYPTALTKEIYELGETLMKELWDGHTPLRLVGIGISEFGENIQAPLFNTVREKRLELEKRIDDLRERFGQNAPVPASVLFLGKRKGADG